jgi:hypothetical protein
VQHYNDRTEVMAGRIFCLKCLLSIALCTLLVQSVCAEGNGSAVAFASVAGASSKITYTVATTVTVGKSKHGSGGSFQLWLDSRLTDSLLAAMWGIGEWSFVLPEESELYSQFESLPPGNARLTFTGSDGKVINSRDLETPLARIELRNSSSDTAHLFLLTQDYSTGVGSYRGLVTTLVRVSDSSIEDVKALDTVSRKEEPIWLTKSGKADWRQLSDSEFLSVSCYPKSPEDKDVTFVVEYTRYTFNETRWLKITNIRDGYWESGDVFPDRSVFP